MDGKRIHTLPLEASALLALGACRWKAGPAKTDCKFFVFQGIKEFLAKIGEGNTASQRLFLKLGFREHMRVGVFKEVVYKYLVEDADSQAILVLSNNLTIGSYDGNTL